MTVKFMENESYMHKMAKEVLKKWFEDTYHDDYMGIGDIRFRSNRESGIFLEYPICSDSWETNWDEIEGSWNEYVPTYDECVNTYNSHPIAIIDVVCSHKGRPYVGIEICHKNPVSQEKINKLKKFGVDNLIEMDAEWILQQTKIPFYLKYRRLI
jgi:hypothetical protein